MSDDCTLRTLNSTNNQVVEVRPIAYHRPWEAENINSFGHRNSCSNIEENSNNVLQLPTTTTSISTHSINPTTSIIPQTSSAIDLAHPVVRN